MLTEREKRGEKLKENIRRLRLAAGMTQNEVAEVLGYASGNIVTRWESGERKPPSDKLPALAAALHCSINDLFEAAQ